MSKAQEMMCKIHVLLVDHDSNTHARIVGMFEYFSYKVTSVKLASSAVSILAKGKMKIDLLVQNIKSPDECGYKLLQIALLMDMPVILLLDEDDIVFTKRALTTGVLLCITKPVPLEIATYLWQLVAREKMCKEKEMEQFIELTTSKRLHNGVMEELVKGCSSDDTSLDESHKLKKKMKCAENANQKDNTDMFKPRKWTPWTQELHEKFVYAVRKLGEGRCYPKDILKLMNVPGLTRMQVASHLQKCRRGTWLHPVVKQPKITAPLPTSGNASDLAALKRFGSMPPLIFNPQSFSVVLKHNVSNQDQDPVMDSSKEDNILGSESGELSQEVCNPFSDVGVEATNMEPVFDMDDSFMSEEKCVNDAQNVAPTANTSLDGHRSVIDEFFEFADMDIMIQNFCASEQVPKDDGGSCELDQVYS